LTIRASCADTGGAIVATEITMPPGGGPPLLHRHDPGEIYHVIDGEFTFYLEGAERRTAVAGDVVPIAGGRAHTIRNESSAPATALVVHAPGEQMERFAHAAAALSSMDEALALAERHGITMLGPLP
jgi:quercetin dioxygenase-like cupin family protein